MNDWLQVAMEPAVVRRALKYAFVVGVLLITINHGYALWHGDRSLLRFMEMGLTMVVPYCVSTLSSVGAIREARGEQTNEQPTQAIKAAKGEEWSI
jgi:hypothetical protein